MLPALERFGNWERPGLNLDSDRCLHAHDRFATCDLCIRACPVGALQRDEGPVRLDSEACVTCGQCLHMCPVGAFSGDAGTADLLHCATRLENDKVIELVCAAHPSPHTGPQGTDAAIVMPGCLAAIGPSAYASLITLGFDRVLVRLDTCRGCPLAALEPFIRDNIHKARAVLRGWQASDRIQPVDRGNAGEDPSGWRERPLHEAQHPPISRRRLFTMFSSEDRQLVVDTLLAAYEPETAKHPPLERYQLLAALRLLPLPPPQALCPAPIEGQTFMQIGANEETCTACGVCVQACPTGALKLVTSDDRRSFELQFVSGACTGSNACFDLCPEEALYRRTVPPFRTLIDPAPQGILAGELYRCAKCGALLAKGLSEKGLCPTCEFRRKNPFGHQMPPKLLAQARRAAENTES